MRRAIWAAVMVALMCETSPALQPYVGCAVYRNAILGHSCPVEFLPTASFDDCISYPDHAGWGMQFTCGNYTRLFMPYFGLSYDHNQQAWPGGQRNDWDNFRFVVGQRIHAPDEIPNPVKPCIGGGFTLGWAHRSADYGNEADGSFDIWRSGEVHADSKLSFGAFLEVGAIVITRSNWLATLSGQSHASSIRISDAVGLGTKDAWEFRVLLGVGYLKH